MLTSLDLLKLQTFVNNDNTLFLPWHIFIISRVSELRKGQYVRRDMALCPWTCDGNLLSAVTWITRAVCTPGRAQTARTLGNGAKKKRYLIVHCTTAPGKSYSNSKRRYASLEFRIQGLPRSQHCLPPIFLQPWKHCTRGSRPLVIHSC